MKNFYKVLFWGAILSLGVSCSDNKMGLEDFEVPEVQTQTKSFAQNDGSTDLSKRSNGYKSYKLLSTAGPAVGMPLGNINITDEQYAEIKSFTDELVANCTTDEQIHSIVHSWLVNNIQYEYYEYVDNDPYPVFKNKKAICQGYANLMKVMLHSQNVPCVLTNGYIPAGGHAWCNVYFNNTWYASDPTNNHYFKSSAYGSNKQYEPTSIDAVLFEDEFCTYGYTEAALNVQSIKEGYETISIPYSAGGFIVSMLSPITNVPTSVKEIYVGANITSLGENIMGLSAKSTTIEQIHIDPDNTVFESFSAGVYYKNNTGDNLAMVAPAAKHIELKSITVFDKECKIKDLPKLETITFVPGTIKIDSWAVERCPRLHTVYMPVETITTSSSFIGVSGAFRIIRGNYTNIPQIKL